MKQEVDSYLASNFDTIQAQRALNREFRWQMVSDLIQKKYKLKVSPDSEYVRGRFRKLVGFVKKEGAYVEDMKQELNYVKEKFQYQSGKESKEQGKKEWTFTASSIPTEEEIVEHFNIDVTKWKVVNIYHKTSFGGKYSITVQTNLLKGVESIDLDQNFINKVNLLSEHTVALSQHLSKNKPTASLLIPKQDAHWNKRDIDGKNSIEDRFRVFTQTLLGQLEKVIKTNSLEKITYLIGSDEFNSEWTKQTTHGTPQDNILTYQQAFEKISEFNIETIKLLRFYAPKIEVVLLNGNHDHNVGWHLATLLKQVFKKNDSIEVNDSIDNTKVIPFHSTLVLLNHGDAVKPKDLAAKFPIIAKDIWSNYENYTVICGDKHHEVAHDFHGTMFYQVPQLSTAKSDWDDKKGFITSKAELLLFLFEEDGLSNILRKQIK